MDTRRVNVTDIRHGKKRENDVKVMANADVYNGCCRKAKLQRPGRSRRLECSGSFCLEEWYGWMTRIYDIVDAIPS